MLINRRWPRLMEALRMSGAVLQRSNNHLIYRLPNGRNFVIPHSPSDHRGEQNALKDLRRMLSL